MELGIKGKRALVTGGATGIGKAIVLELIKEGVLVAFTSRRQDDLDALLAEVGGPGSGHYAVKIDQLEDDGSRCLAEEIWREFGQIDILVNNVGSTLDITDPECPITDWRKVFRMNLEVHVELNNLLIPHMRAQGWGRIVNISAGSAMENNGPVTYCSIKAALTAYSRSMGRVLAESGIVMSALQPGVVFTERGHWAEVIKTRPEHAEKYLQERTVLKRFGTPDEISPMVALLCSEQASFCQGAIVPVDGGQAKHYFHFPWQ
ncbi:MAG: SDR family NAD(P)-dependent oxidoreductase [Candidatus Neomarinimicrobiota bacterium]